MKNLILTLMFAVGTLSCNAQILISLLFGEALNTDKISFGLTLGTNISKLSNLEDAKYRSEFNLGLFFDFKGGENFYFPPEALVKNSVGARGLAPYPTSDPELDDIFKDGEVEREISIISVPILAKYRTDNGWGIEAGPQFGLRTKAFDIFRTGLSDKEDLELKVDIRDELIRINVGGAVGLSKKVGKGIGGVTILARYHFGLIDIYKDNPGDPIRTGGFIINGTIPVGAGKKAQEVPDTDG